MNKTNYDPNREETEEDGLIAGQLRLLKAHHQYKELTGRTHSLLPLPKNMQKRTEYPSKGNQNVQK